MNFKLQFYSRLNIVLCFYASFRVFYWYPGVEIICNFLPFIVASLFFYSFLS